MTSDVRDPNHHDGLLVDQQVTVEGFVARRKSTDAVKLDLISGYIDNST